MYFIKSTNHYRTKEKIDSVETQHNIAQFKLQRFLMYKKRFLNLLQQIKQRRSYYWKYSFQFWEMTIKYY